MRERFVQVEQLVVDITFTDLKGTGHYSAQVRSLSRSAKAFFAFACPRTLCLAGGFDLDSIIRAMLDAERATAVGTLQCHGWVDPSRAEHARCLLQLHYRLQARYGAPEVGAFQPEAATPPKASHARLKLG
jgi:hypothetical protein